MPKPVPNPILPLALRRSSRALWLLRILLLPLWLIPVVGDAAVRVAAVRVWPAPEYTRITIESPQPIEYTLFSVAEPKRLVLDLENVELTPPLEGLHALIGSSDPFVAQTRVGRFKPDVVRVVLELHVDVKPQAFALRPVGDYAHRLVLDIYPVVPPDPLLALLEKIETDKVAADSASAAASPPTEAPASASGPEAAAESRDGTPAARPQVASRATSSKAAQANTVRKNKTKPTTVRLVTVAIDPGHGGEDPGARGKLRTEEKDITLAIARRLKARIDADPKMRAVLTRDGDYFVSLLDRVNKARRARADLFVSIHADAFVKPHARGSSVFALSQRGATSAAARWLAQKENEADLIGGVNLDVADPYVKQVLLDLSQTATINDSIRFGRAVLESLGVINTLHKPRVEQAGFAVLKAPDMPSILVETAFISNPAEERKLRDAAYQEKMASAILEGIRAYLAKNPPLARDKVAQSP